MATFVRFSESICIDYHSLGPSYSHLCVKVVSQLGLSFHEGSDTVDHVLHEILLRSSESPEVGDIEDTVVGLGVLAVDASDLHLVLVGDLVEDLLVFHELGQVDVHRGSHGGSEVGGTGRDVTEMVITGESCDRFDVGGGSAQSLEDSCDVSALLHGDDSQLILFVDPDEEGLGVVVEDTSARRPVSVESA